MPWYASTFAYIFPSPVPFFYPFRAQNKPQSDLSFQISMATYSHMFITLVIVSILSAHFQAQGMYRHLFWWSDRSTKRSGLLPDSYINPMPIQTQGVEYSVKICLMQVLGTLIYISATGTKISSFNIFYGRLILIIA